MTRFNYRAMTFDGRETAGEAEASDAEGLAIELGRRGLLLVEAKALKAADSWRSLLSLPPDPAEVTAFLSDLSLVLKSGQPIDEALSLVAEGMTGALGRIVRAVRTDLMRGTSFVDALGKHRDVFSADLIALARVAEATGHLEGAIEAAATQRARTQALSDKLAASLRYPAFLLCSAIGVVVFFLLYVIPQFADVIKDAGGDRASSDASTMLWLLYLSDVLNKNLDYIIVGIIICLGAVLLAKRYTIFNQKVAKIIAQLPFIRGTIELRRTALFCINLGTLLTQGVPMPDALKVLEAMIGGAAADGLARIGDHVRRGGSLSSALEAHAFLPKAGQRMIKMGEESGELAEVASRAGLIYEKKLDQRLDRFAALVGPIAILLISSLIGGLMVTIMSALVSVNQLVM